MDGVDLLAKVTRLLESKRIMYWVFGGYALDIAVGRLTREHANIDLLVRLRDVGKVHELLELEDFVVDFVHDRMIAKRGRVVVNINPLDEFKGDYVISSLHTEAHVPKHLLDNVVKGELLGKNYKRVPNELLFLFMRYSINQSDALLVKNLKISKSRLKAIKVVIKRR